MKKLILTLVVTAGCLGLANAQRNPQPTPTPLMEDPLRQQGLDRQGDMNKRAQELRNAENFPVKENKEAKIFQEYIKPLYREPGKEELKAIAPEAEDLEKFAEFLRQPRTGLVKLVPEKNCDENQKVVAASPDCTKYAIPGAGSSYSFRIDNYRMQRLADINYTGRSFRGFGLLTHGIFVNLGDVPLEKVDLQSEALTFLTKIKPVSDLKEAQEFALQLDKGIKNNEFTYRNILPVVENTTYVLRSIAYKGNVVRSIQSISYDEMEMDKRKDIVVAFRVVRRDPDGSVTLLWKELASKNVPKLK